MTHLELSIRKPNCITLDSSSPRKRHASHQKLMAQKTRKNKKKEKEEGELCCLAGVYRGEVERETAFREGLLPEKSLYVSHKCENSESWLCGTTKGYAVKPNATRHIRSLQTHYGSIRSKHSFQYTESRSVSEKITM